MGKLVRDAEALSGESGAGAAGGDSWGIEGATANRDRWHCKCRLVT